MNYDVVYVGATVYKRDVTWWPSAGMIDGHTARLLSFVSIQWIRWTSDNFYVCFPPPPSKVTWLLHLVSIKSLFKKKHVHPCVTLAICVNGHRNTKIYKYVSPSALHSGRAGFPDWFLFRCDPAQLIPAALECFISFLIKNDGVCGFFIRNFSNVRRQTIKTKRKRAKDRNVIHFDISRVAVKRKSPTIQGSQYS